MKKNMLALAVYRSVKAANDDGSSAIPLPGTPAASLISASTPPGWDPFEVWRTRVRPGSYRGTREKR